MLYKSEKTRLKINEDQLTDTEKRLWFTVYIISTNPFLKLLLIFVIYPIASYYRRIIACLISKQYWSNHEKLFHPRTHRHLYFAEEEKCPPNFYVNEMTSPVNEPGQITQKVRFVTYFQCLTTNKKLERNVNLPRKKGEKEEMKKMASYFFSVWFQSVISEICSLLYSGYHAFLRFAPK